LERDIRSPILIGGEPKHNAWDEAGVTTQFQEVKCHHNRNNTQQIKRGRIQELHFRLPAILAQLTDFQNLLLRSA
jgi:hypothetical protein